MDKKKKPPFKRRVIQLYAALLYNANLAGFSKGRIYTGKLKAACTPGLNCYSCPGAAFACPLGALQNAFVSSNVRLPFYMLGILMLYGLMLGRTICGFLCPFGLIQELLNKIPTPKIKKSRLTKKLTYIKYVILGLFVVAVPLLLHFPAFCKYICPAGTFEGGYLLLLNPANSALTEKIGVTFLIKSGIFILILILSIFLYRVFCRFLCPLGALYGLFSKICLFGVKVDPDLCTSCNACVHACPMDIKKPGDRECIHCGKCIEVCGHKALSFCIGKKKIKVMKRKTKLITGFIALMLLASVLIFTGISSLKKETEVQAGYSVGEKLPEIEVTLLNGETFSTADASGNTLIINFWATWCSPCIEELPDFSRFNDDHSDVTVLALHVGESHYDVLSFVNEKGYTMNFGLDDGTLYNRFSSLSAIPYTVIVNKEGIIIYSGVGKINYETLESYLR